MGEMMDDDEDDDEEEDDDADDADDELAASEVCGGLIGEEDDVRGVEMRLSKASSKSAGCMARTLPMKRVTTCRRRMRLKRGGNRDTYTLLRAFSS